MKVGLVRGTEAPLTHGHDVEAGGMPDRMAFEGFVEGASRRLVGAAWLLTGDLGTAEDLAQDTLERVYRNWSRIRDHEYALLYAHKTLTRLAWRRLPSHRRWRQSLIGEVTDFEAIGAVETEESGFRVRAALGSLPPRQRQVLVLRYFCDLSVDDTAVVLRCKPSTVKAHTRQGLERLRALLGATDDRAPT